jgi:AmmeMemoRadiSam system protein B
VDSYLAAATPPALPGDLIGLVAPHAGYRYAGPVLGQAYAPLRGLSPSLVAVIGPMHHPYHQEVLTTGHDAYLTPLGAVPVAREQVEALDRGLRRCLGIGLAPVLRDPEHALEIELPFLQRVLGGPFRLLPVMIRDQSPAIVRELGGCLAEVLQGQAALLVASTDLSHFYPQAAAEKLDAEMLRRIEAFDPEAVLEAEDEQIGFACGRGAVAAVLWAAKALGAVAVQVLGYATSGDVNGDRTSVVGYGAAAILAARNPLPA